MAKLVLNSAKKLTKDYYKVFNGVYNDFKIHSKEAYKFELDPLPYEDFLESVDAGLIDCYILLEDEIPTGFLAYTTAISAALELNIIHCIGNENLNQKRKILLSKFLDDNKHLTEQLVVTYPMLGSQKDFVPYITHFSFKLVNLAVVKFLFSDSSSLNIFQKVYPTTILTNYQLQPWKEEYFNCAVEVLNEAFIDSTDALFDPRFKTKEGTADILKKITSGIYGEFLPDSVRVAFQNEQMCGICLANITAGTIANIPLVGLTKSHRGKGLSKYLLASVVNDLLQKSHNGTLSLSEVNASVETENNPAVKMYRAIGFKEDYCYPQAFLPCSNIDASDD